MVRIAKEPTKFEKNAKGRWVLSAEWKAWRDEEKKPKHKAIWREIARDTATDKRIYFCACGASSGEPFRGCGAVAVGYGRTLPTIVIESRFE